MEDDSQAVVISSDSNAKISLMSSILMLAGSIIGTGIFMTPNDVVKEFPSVFYSLMIWVACGIISFLAALCYAEMGSKFPSLGGEYTYFREIFHEMISFSYLITNYFLIRPVCIAMLAIFFAKVVVSQFSDVDNMLWTVKLVSILTMIIICIINCLSENLTIRVNDVLTYIKFLAMAIIIVLGIIKLCKREFENILDPGFTVTTTPSKIASAVYNGMFAYDGFNCLGYIVTKMKNPRKHITWATSLGMLLVIVFYLLINFSYLVILGVKGLSESKDVAVSCVEPYFGKFTFIMAILVGLSAFASANSTSYSGGNLFFDGSQNGHFPPMLGAYHTKLKTFIPALIAQTIVTIFYIFAVPNLSELLVYFSGASWMYYSLVFLGVIIARFNPRIKESISKCARKPFELFIGIPIFTFIISLGVIILGFVNEEFRIPSVISLCIVFSSVPLYFIFIYRGGIMPLRLRVTIEKLTKKVFEAFSLTDKQL